MIGILKKKRKSQWETKAQGVETSGEYWTRINVTDHAEFRDAAHSLENFEWRNMLYSNYIELMPVKGADGLRVLDYGCGPGHDVVGFICHSNPELVLGVDVSTTSLKEAQARLSLHEQANWKLLTLKETDKALPLEDESFDLIHSSGVVHHIVDALSVLKEFRRLIRPGGHCQIMVYNYYSVFTHLWVAYHQMRVHAANFEGMSFEEVFQRSTDGPECPVSRWYKPNDFIALCNEAGFNCEFSGAAVANIEMQNLHTRFEAMVDDQVPHESRRFLYDLEFDTRGRPIYNGHIAGLDGCFRLTPA